MGQLIPLENRQFGILTVLKRAPNRGKHIYYKCKCACGKTVEVRNDKLTNGQAISCGCKRKKRSDCKYDTANSRLYAVYTAMKQRCLNERCRAYKNYGGRGIKICGSWLEKGGFEEFQTWAYKSGYQEAEYGKYTLDRIDVNGDYEPQNCRWTTIQEQQNNTTRNIILEYKGEKHNIKKWSEIRELSYSKILKRLKLGWSVAETLGYKEKHYGT